MTKFTNNGRAPFRIGGVTLRPGASANVEVSDDEMDRLRRKSFLGIEGVERDPGSMTLEQLNETSLRTQTTDPDMVRQNDDLKNQLERMQNALTSSAASVDDLTQQLADANHRISELERALAAAGADTPAPDQPEILEGLTAKHKGGGSYSVLQGDNELVSGLTKDQSDEFNKMDDAAKSQYVRDAQKASQD